MSKGTFYKSQKDTGGCDLFIWLFYTSMLLFILLCIINYNYLAGLSY